MSEVKPEAMSIALLEMINKSLLTANKLLEQEKVALDNISKNQEPNDYNLSYTIDLTIAHTNVLLIDTSKDGIKANALAIPITPSPFTIRLNSLNSEPIDIAIGGSLSLVNHKIDRIYITNVASVGTVTIQVLGRRSHQVDVH